LAHNRVATPIDEQVVIRMNRDTLYSTAVVDISKGATLTLPESGDRYMTAEVINEDHYMNRVISEPGTYELTMDEYDTPFVMVTIRTLIDPNDPADAAEVAALQDAIVIESVSNEPYTHPEYDEETRIATLDAFQPLIEAIPDTSHSFGSKDEVDPIRHLLATASGWGRSARTRGVLLRRDGTATCGPLHVHARRGPRRRILVAVDLQP
jgi:hypothetical protein